MKHFAIYLSNNDNKNLLLENILNGKFLLNGNDLSITNTAVFSAITVDKLIDEEFRHDKKIVTTANNVSLSTMSSGEQRQAVLQYLLAQHPSHVILDDVFANFDAHSRHAIELQLSQLVNSVCFIQFFYRTVDLLPCMTHVVLVQHGQPIEIVRKDAFVLNHATQTVKEPDFILPHMLFADSQLTNPIVKLANIRVSYNGKQVINDLNWTIRKGEFWQLAGENGSGKSTLLSMICGDNPKAYGQDVYLFGYKRGSGESIWDIKRHIGYFAPDLLQQFTRPESTENMIISGFNDSIGLYKEPTDLQRKIARMWMQQLGENFNKRNFRELTSGQQRMVMVARALVKQPPLLILDEPTVELDDENTALFLSMIHAIAATKRTAIVYVSHRYESNLKPSHILTLVPDVIGYKAV